MHEAKTQLSRLVERVQRGEEITIARNGVPVARLAPVPEKRKGKRGLVGLMEGEFEVDDSAFSPEADREVMEMFGIDPGDYDE